jgi:thiol-disulfide isomerase/thioredoxin
MLHCLLVAVQLLALSAPTIAFGSLLPATLTTTRGEPVQDLASRLSGKSVGLYFAAAWCPACQRFLPALKKWHAEAVAEGKPVELIFVSSGETKPEYDAHLTEMGDWLAVPYGDVEGRNALMKKYGLYAGAASMPVGVYDRRGDAPAVAVLKPDGKMLMHLDAEQRGAGCLRDWKPAQFPPWGG